MKCLHKCSFFTGAFINDVRTLFVLFLWGTHTFSEFRFTCQRREYLISIFPSSRWCFYACEDGGSCNSPHSKRSLYWNLRVVIRWNFNTPSVPQYMSLLKKLRILRKHWLDKIFPPLPLINAWTYSLIQPSLIVIQLLRRVILEYWQYICMGNQK